MCGMGLGWWKPSSARQAMLASLRGRASGHVCRVNRPNTRLLLTKYNYFKKRLAKREPSTQDKAPFSIWIVVEFATLLSSILCARSSCQQYANISLQLPSRSANRPST
jgi:hypothetical protein